MNSLYTLGLRQTASINGDLEKLRSGDSSNTLQSMYFVRVLEFS